MASAEHTAHHKGHEHGYEHDPAAAKSIKTATLAQLWAAWPLGSGKELSKALGAEVGAGLRGMSGTVQAAEHYLESTCVHPFRLWLLHFRQLPPRRSLTMTAPHA